MSADRSPLTLTLRQIRSGDRALGDEVRAVARACQRMGMSAEAWQEYRHVLEMKPGFAPALGALKRWKISSKYAEEQDGEEHH